MGQILGILENFDLTDLAPLDNETVHLFSQAGRLAFADRGKYVGDSDFVSVPVAGMLDEHYLKTRADMITDVDMGYAPYGIPPGAVGVYGADNGAKLSGTSHVSIVDRYGNALSMTTTVESSFGNGVMVRGFLLNNELTDFSFAYEDDDGIPIANRVQANKRPRSSMSPTIVFNSDGNVELVTGSPGGSRIIGYTAQSIMNVLDFGLDPQEAVNIPHFQNRNNYTQIEEPIPGVTLDYDTEALEEELLARDHTVSIGTMTSGLSVIQVVESSHGKKHKHHGWGRCHKRGYLVGGADHRRDGAVGGR